MSYFYIFLTIAFTIYGQIIIKWQMSMVGQLPVSILAKMQFLFSQLLNPWILSSFVAAGFAAFSWMLVMTKMELSAAYPLISLTFVGVLLAGTFIFHEPISIPKLIGVILIILGISISTMSKSVS